MSSRRDFVKSPIRTSFGRWLAPGALLGAALAAAAASLASPAGPAAAGSTRALDGYPIDHEPTVRYCAGCHRPDDEARLGRISFMRKTPEGWQASVRRMVALHGVRLDPEAAREIVRYLSNAQGLAPEEVRPGFFDAERRMIEYRYDDQATERTCGACHSMGRVITQRRTREEWSLLVATHRALYPLVDGQRFRDGGASGPDRRHPMDEAIDHLAGAFPLETREWSAWSANVRPARLEGAWSVAGHDPARGPVLGRIDIRAVPGTDDEFTTEAALIYPESGAEVRRSGRAVVYTGHQWRGRSTRPDGSGELREVMAVERGWNEMSGRWFTGAYDEIGLDITLRRMAAGPFVSGVFPPALRAGQADLEVRVFGANLPAPLSAGSVDFGAGVRVLDVRGSDAELAVLRVAVDDDAPPGRRDLYLAGVTRTDAIAVYDRVDAIRVRPRGGLARVGGEWAPKQYQQFEAIAYHRGRDGRSDTEDDVELGRVPVEWSLEEYPVTFDDDDIEFVGEIDANGLFTPAADGPNPERSGNRNNIGDVWVVATYSPPDGSPLRGRAQLIVTVPLYMFWDPWPVAAERDIAAERDDGRADSPGALR